MAAPIAAIVVASPTRNASRLLAYALNKKKGQTTDRFVAASGLNGAIPEVAAAQYRDNRKRHGKNGERQVQVPDGKGGMRTITEGAYVQGYHLIQSFARDGEGALDPDDPEAWEKAHRLGRKFARRLAGDGRMAVVVTQIDGETGCIHNHIVLDSIDRQTGKSFASSNVKHKVLAQTHDEVLREAGYDQQNELHSTAAERREPSEERARLRHEQWVANGRQGPEPFSVAVMKQRVREGMSDPRSVSFETYAEVLAERGVRVERRGEKGDGLTYEMVLSDGQGGTVDPQPAHRRRASKLGRDFMLAGTEEALERNRSRVAAQPAVRRPLLDPNKYLGLVGGDVQAPAPAAPTPDPTPDDPERPLLWRTYERAGLDWRKARKLAAAKPEPEPTSDAVEPVPPAPVPAVEAAAAPTEPEDKAEAPEAQEGAQGAAAPAYCSPMRDLIPPRERDREFYERLAVLDEHIVQQADAGGLVDDALMKGIGTTHLTRYRPHLDRRTAEAISARARMHRAAQDAYDMGDRVRAQRIRGRIAQGRYWGPATPQAVDQAQLEPEPERGEPELG
ncbi:relaxase/mobilization nuclease domain-containing protein [Micrococcus luteus]|uniref:relaxase/mobilization nuclease domain-containing protein n=1 Tax=Micrococcus luteus TaxID=1270 RepID=UPI001E494A9D|nr:relaxase/mobilization nuclease domain-containing protein [Micrococcus luteus]MCD0172531.1 relaxase/mobilization nuclease domain-containing protein [Micrococcus luteus]